jgi:hypothetical protein
MTMAELPKKRTMPSDDDRPSATVSGIQLIQQKRLILCEKLSKAQDELREEISMEYHNDLFYECLRGAEYIDRQFGIFPSLDDKEEQDKSSRGWSYSIVVMGSDDTYQTIGMVVQDDDDRLKPTEVPPTFKPILQSHASNPNDSFASSSEFGFESHIHAVAAGGWHSVVLMDGVPYSLGKQ